MARSSLESEANATLDRLWNRAATPTETATLPDEIGTAIDSLVNARTKSYRYAILVQLLAKSVDETLDCRSVQAQGGLDGAFDARSLCDAIVVPFDRANSGVLGGSSEPYANNPLRIPALTAAYRAAQKNKAEFDQLCAVLDFAQANPRLAESLLLLTLVAVRRRLQLVQIVYPVPIRISQGNTIELLSSFLRERAGGVRLQAVIVGLLREFGRRFRAFERVDCRHVNAADASTGMVADVECWGSAGELVLVAEIKDRELALRHTQDKLPAARQRGVRELFFFVQSGVAGPDRSAMDELVQREFDAGQNIYVFDHVRFCEYCTAILGEPGRREFLIQIGVALDEQKADLKHRLAWRDLLARY